MPETDKTPTTQEELDRAAEDAKRASDDWEDELDRVDQLGEEKEKN